MERATFRRDVVGTWSTATRSSRVFERVAEGKRRENSKTSLQKDRWHDDQRMSIHGRRSSVSGAEPSFDISDYRFSSSSPCFLSTVSRDLFPRAPPLKLSTERRNLVSYRSSILPCFVANLYIYSSSREKSSFQGIQAETMLIDDCKSKSLKA